MSKKNNTAKPVATAPADPTDAGEGLVPGTVTALTPGVAADAGEGLVPGTDTAVTTDATADAGSSEVIAGDLGTGSNGSPSAGDGTEATTVATDSDTPAGELGGEGGSITSTEPADELVRVKLLCSNHLGNIGDVTSVPWHHVADLEAAGLVDSHPASVGEE